MPTSQPTESTASTQPPRPRLVCHSKRHQWGRALMVWEREGKRAYQFEDGQLRIFAEPYFKFLQPTPKPDPIARHRLRQQAVAAGEIVETPIDAKTAPIVATNSTTLDDQITIFRALYPAGFEDPKWLDEVRVSGKGRRAKRHRDAAIAEARELLDPAKLTDLINEGRPSEVLKRVLDVLGRTDLVTRQQLSSLTSIDADTELASALLDFLYDQKRSELETMPRLRRALARHGVKNVSWAVLTAPRSLLHPNDHMHVRLAHIRSQAKLIPKQRHKPGSTPSAADYARCLDLAMVVREHLTKADLRPSDLFDVTHFMGVTLKAANKEQLLEAMVERTAKERAKAESDADSNADEERSAEHSDAEHSESNADHGTQDKGTHRESSASDQPTPAE